MPGPKGPGRAANAADCFRKQFFLIHAVLDDTALTRYPPSVRLFSKLFLLLTLCAAVPLAFLGGTALWRTRALRQELLEASARTGQAGADTGERALFAESRRLHRRVVAMRADELEDFFEEGRKLVALQTAVALRALAEAPPSAGPPLRSDAYMAELRKDPKGLAAVARIAPYSVYRLAPGTALDAVRPKLERFARLGDYYAFAHRETKWLKSLYIGSPEGFLIGYPGAAPFPEGYDPRKGDWYKKAVEKGRVTWSSIYLDKDGKPVITVAEPFFVDGRLAGVSAADIVLESLLDRLFDLTDLPASEAVLINWQGAVRIAADTRAAGKFKWRSWAPDDAPLIKAFYGGALEPAYRAALRERSGTLVEGESLLSFARVFIRTRAGGKEWYYLVRTPVAEVIGPAREARAALEKLQASLAEAIDAQARALQLALALVALLALAAALGAAVLGGAPIRLPPLRAWADRVSRASMGRVRGRSALCDRGARRGQALAHPARSPRRRAARPAAERLGRYASPQLGLELAAVDPAPFAGRQILQRDLAHGCAHKA